MPRLHALLHALKLQAGLNGKFVSLPDWDAWLGWTISVLVRARITLVQPSDVLTWLIAQENKE